MIITQSPKIWLPSEPLKLDTGRQDEAKDYEKQNQECDRFQANIVMDTIRNGFRVCDAAGD